MSTHADIAAFFAQFEGKQVYGGCEHCEAYQTTSVDGDGMFHVHVHHDDWCPAWRKIQARR